MHIKGNNYNILNKNDRGNDQLSLDRGYLKISWEATLNNSIQIILERYIRWMVF